MAPSPSLPAIPEQPPAEIVEPNLTPEMLGEPQSLRWPARGLLGLAGGGLGGTAIWALMMNGKEGAMPTAMIILGTLLVLIAVAGHLPDTLTAGDWAIQFARQAKREVRKAADAVADNTPPEERAAVVAELQATERRLPDHVGRKRLSDLDKRSIDRGRVFVERVLSWERELQESIERSASLELHILHALDQAVPRVAERTGKPLKLVRESASRASRVDYEITWPPGRRILIEVRLQVSMGATDIERVARIASAHDERLGLLVLTSDDSLTISNLLLLEASLQAAIGGPVMVRPAGEASVLTGYLSGLVDAVDS